MSCVFGLLHDSRQGSTIRDDLHSGLQTMPSWMQKWIRDLFARSELDSIEAKPSIGAGWSKLHYLILEYPTSEQLKISL
jgi:hypothetical protein